MTTIRAPGRIVTVGPGVAKLNPHLFSKPEERDLYMRDPDDPKDPTRKRIRQGSKPLLNKLESDFKEWYERTTGYKVMCQAMRFRLGNGIWYKPDFTHLSNLGSLTCIEVKGPHAFRGGFENLKVAATLYPQFAWRLWWREGGEWRHQAILG